MNFGRFLGYDQKSYDDQRVRLSDVLAVSLQRDGPMRVVSLGLYRSERTSLAAHLVHKQLLTPQYTRGLKDVAQT